MIPEDFPSGRLLLPSEPFDVAIRTSWSGNPVVSGIIIVAMVVFLVCFRNALSFLPYAWQALWRWKPNVTIQHNLHLCAARRAACFGMLIPFLLIVYRYSIIRPEIWAGAGAAAIYMATKELLALAVPHKKIAAEYWRAARHCFLTYFVPAVMLMLLTELANLALQMPTETTKMVMEVEFGCFYFLSIVRSAQIINTAYHPIVTFLYLCGFEVLSTGLIAVLAMIL